MRVVLPSVPLHVALTPVPSSVKTEPAVPLVRPLTGPSKPSVSTMVWPAVLPGTPVTAALESVGAVVSMVGSGAVSSMAGISPMWAKALPATSRMPASSAAFSAASSIVAGPFWPAAMV